MVSKEIKNTENKKTSNNFFSVFSKLNKKHNFADFKKSKWRRKAFGCSVVSDNLLESGFARGKIIETKKVFQNTQYESLK